MSEIIQPQKDSSCSNSAGVPSPEEQIAAYFKTQPSLHGLGDSEACLVEEPFAAPGFTLPCGFDDPTLCDSNVVLLARKNKKLTAFKGSGYIVVEDGKASLVDHLVTKISQLWHYFTRSSGQVVLGKPKPAPFLAVVDEYRQVHAIGGLPDGDAQLLHDPASGGWQVLPSGKMPKKQQGKLPEASSVQLTGFTPLSSLVSDQTVREIQALGGEGVVVLTKQPAPKTTLEEGECPDACEDNLQSVASVVPFPAAVDPCETEPECYTFKFCTADRALKFVADTETSLPEGLTGNEGA